jgi:hypothetical protein
MKSSTAKTSVSSASPAKQLAGFIAKFNPAVARTVKAARAVLQERYPAAIELVYDNYNALAIGFSSSEKTSDVIFSLAVYPRWVDLYFMYGRSLPDPDRLLQGKGTQGGFVRLENLDVLDQAGVKALLSAAVKQADPPLATRGKGYTIIKSISAKQRPRRPE